MSGMKYDKEILENVLHSLENEKIRAEADAEARKLKIYGAMPRVAEIDAALRTTVFDVIRASFGKNEDTATLIARAKEKNLALVAERKKLLAEANIPESALEPGYSCEVCNDSGYTGGELCPCVITRYRRAVADEINKKLVLKKSDFAEFDISRYPENGAALSPRAQMREVLEFSRDYAESFGAESENLFLTGGPGLGKTFLASCIARRVADRGFSVVFGTAFSVLGEYEAVKFGRSDENTDIYETCDLLILDDVGREMKTPFTVAALFNIVNMRLNADKKTVIISSCEENDIIKDYGPAFFSRIKGDFIKLEFLGNDMRRN